MSLESLPTEIYLQILRYAGVSDFPLQLSLLTISKRWFEIAHSISFQHVKLFPRTNGDFLCVENEVSKDFTISPKIRQPMLDEIASITNVDTLSSKLRSLELDLLNITTSLPPFPGARATETTPVEGHTWRMPRKASIHHLRAFIRSCQHLKALDIRVSVTRPASVPIWSLPHVLELPDLSTLLAAPQKVLTSLVVDVQYDPYFYAAEAARSQICRDIAANLPTLRRLCVRMPWICPDALSLPDDANATTIPLREVVVNLTTWSKMGRDGFLDSSKSCRAGYRHQFNHVRDMTAAIQRLRAWAPRLEVARLIKRESFKTPMSDHRDVERMNVAFDCLTGEEGLVDKEADWTREFGMEEMNFQGTG
ncbi:hypothetical protein BU16DRAFT_126314 [Lophium mytilinum]|uniref:F-box domain-containing protein n=1 Tax=Lophium mytilinum TaxID=390894 RepID=A0A6A6QH00_9PEZI|nr:hypothetical protein BU16DRAFT_126314 [Lophium mytilinum]